MSTCESDYAKRVVELSMQLANSRADVENLRMRIKAVDEEHEQLKKDRADMVDRFDAALRRAKVAVWQPFETAPKEWNEILVVYTKCKPRVYELVYFNTVHKYWMCKGEPRLNLERSECYWMPISNFDDARAAQIEEGE